MYCVKLASAEYRLFVFHCLSSITGPWSSAIFTYLTFRFILLTKTVLRHCKTMLIDGGKIHTLSNVIMTFLSYLSPPYSRAPLKYYCVALKWFTISQRLFIYVNTYIVRARGLHHPKSLDLGIFYPDWICINIFLIKRPVPYRPGPIRVREAAQKATLLTGADKAWGRDRCRSSRGRACCVFVATVSERVMRWRSERDYRPQPTKPSRAIVD